MTDSHHLLEAWLVEGAIGDPPRELAVHASVCESCARRLGAFDSLGGVDVGAAGSPPPLPPPTRVAAALLWARVATAVAGTVVAGILVVFGLTQLVGIVGSLESSPRPSIVGLATPADSQNSGDTPGPQPAVEPSLATEPSGTPIPSFIPLPSVAPNEPPPDPPSAPGLSLSSVAANSISIRWTPGAGGGEVQKWEIWRRTGFGSWFKLGEVFPTQLSLTNTGLSSGTTYSYQVRGVNSEWLGPFSNVIAATTTPAPTPAPTPIPPTPTPQPTPAPACSDGLDNDGDGYADLADPGCESVADNDELPLHLHACNNGLDDDGDGYTDLGDPSCGGDPFGNSELPIDLHQCNDGVDNDGDLLTDFPLDLGCTDAFDDDESGP